MNKVQNTLSSGTLGLDDCFRFQCDDRLSCFMECCTGSNVWLTPYDIVRLKTALAMTSGAFLERYTQTHYGQADGYPVLTLIKENGGTGKCPFGAGAGCMVYGDRPWVCRLFPLELVNGDARPSAVANEHDPRFEVNQWEHCRGFGRGDAVSIQQWRDRQGLVEYEDINREWKKVTHHPEFSSRNLLEGEAAELFRLGCYDIDRFRHSVFAGELRNEFDAGRELPKGARTGDAELLQFAFRWLRQVLFGEDISAMRYS